MTKTTSLNKTLKVRFTLVTPPVGFISHPIHSLIFPIPPPHPPSPSFSPPLAGRFSRYKQQVGTGRFKTVFRGFDERRGVDVAWGKIYADDNHLNRDQMHKVVEDMSTGLSLDHPHVIKSFQCWEDTDHGCVNFITEYFTSGNLRDYRFKHKSLDMKAMKKWARQILQGLAYLHQRQPPVVHGDLRPDKIYINGHSGEIKIGDLGLAVLVPKRFEPGVMPEGDPMDQYTRAVDIFAFGLVMLELVSLRKMNKSTSSTSWQTLLESVVDQAARAFIRKCLSPLEERPTAMELLKDPFVQIQKPTSTAGGGVPGNSASRDNLAASVGPGFGGIGGSGNSARNSTDFLGGGSSHTLRGGAAVLSNGIGATSSLARTTAGGGGGRGGDGGAPSSGPTRGGGGEGRIGGGGAGGGGGGSSLQGGSMQEGSGSRPDPPSRRSTEDKDQQRAECEAGSVQGEDYLFQFSGKIKDGKLHFRLHMHWEGDEDEDGGGGGGGNSNGREEDENHRTSKTIDFVYDPDVDTPDEIAAEISSEFSLSPTDTDICAAALKEWLAQEGPDTADMDT